MLSLGALAFLQPLFLIGLAALPVLWWLLRAVPPAPRREKFPGVRVLLGIEDKERTPQRTPWWLLLLRLVAAAALLLAFAQPLLNPQTRLTGEGPLLLVLDGGWGSAADWADRRGFALDVLAQAQQAERPTAVVVLADPRAGAPDAPTAIALKPASESAEALATLDPAPWRPDPQRWTPSLEAFLGSDGAAGLETVWLHDGLAHEGGPALAELLAEGSGAGLRLIGPESAVAALLPPVFKDGKLSARAIRAETVGAAAISVAAIGGGALEADGAAAAESEAPAVAAPAERRLAQATLRFAAGEREAEVEIDLPLPLLNQLARIEVLGARHAGGVTLLDDRFRRKSVAVVSGERVSSAQPLLSSAHYVKAALAPHAVTREATLAAALGLPEPGEAALAPVGERSPSWADVIVLADVGEFDAEVEAALVDWVAQGGLLIRFAGPQLAAQTVESRLLQRRFGRRGAQPAEDPLLPVRLRAGGRELGGALSWSTPQPLRAFPADSPFAGLTARPDVTVARQVLAEPSPQLAERVWAALADGTPLVTAKPLGAGRVVLFHVSGRPDWSSLPLSGLFVEMMERLMSATTAVASAAALGEAGEAGTTWSATRILDGYGALSPASGDLAPITTSTLKAGVRPGVAPGFYEADTDAGRASQALNAIEDGATLAPRGAAPAGAGAESLGGETETPLKPWLLGAAFVLLMIDILAAMALAGRLRGGVGARGAAALALGAVLAFGGAAVEARAQGEAPARIDPAEQRASLETVLAYVITGDARVDRISEAGLKGLSATLRQRSSIEPGDPAGVDLETDEVAVYALLYWPITDRQPALSVAAARKLNAYMRTGGMILIDTRDQHRTFGSGAGPNAKALRALMSGLDIPPLAPASNRHVLTRTFYLLDAFPGRWTGGQVWLEAGSGGEEALERGAAGRSGAANDGVSPVIIGGHDWAGAWAIDAQGRPLLPLGRGGVRQREMALRFGVNVAMYAYTGNYKSDQVHIPALLDRLGN